MSTHRAGDEAAEGEPGGGVPAGAERPYLSLVPPWRVEPARLLQRTRILDLSTRRCTSPTDPSRGGDFVYLRCPDWVNTIAVTEDGRVVMVEQFRYGLAEVTLELPGGVVDPGEGPAETCRRELLEETGFAGEPVRMLGWVSANPAMQDNRVHTGLVAAARRVGGVSLDEHEEIGVRLVPMAEVPGLVRRGVIHHTFVLAALHMLHLHGLEGMSPP